MLRVSLCLSLLLLLSACQTQTQSEPTSQHAPDTHVADEATLRTVDADWSKAASARDVDKTVSYYAADAQVFPPNSPVLTSKDSIHAMWKGMLGMPGFAGGWKSTKVEVSGTLGYVSGTYEFSETDAKGKPTTDKGKYVAVFRKQTDGTWKCVADIFNTDLPPGPTK